MIVEEMVGVEEKAEVNGIPAEVQTEIEEEW